MIYFSQAHHAALCENTRRDDMEKILIVDDSAVQAIQLRTILETDYEITVAQTAEDCLAYAGI